MAPTARASSLRNRLLYRILILQRRLDLLHRWTKLSHNVKCNETSRLPDRLLGTKVCLGPAVTLVSLCARLEWQALAKSVQAYSILQGRSHASKHLRVRQACQSIATPALRIQFRSCGLIISYLPTKPNSSSIFHLTHNQCEYTRVKRMFTYFGTGEDYYNYRIASRANRKKDRNNRKTCSKIHILGRD